jgi:DNA-directed RNA polymerase subunit RPC12/RpoP
MGMSLQKLRAYQCISCGQVFRTPNKYDRHDCPKRVKVNRPQSPDTGEK